MNPNDALLALIADLQRDKFSFQQERQKQYERAEMLQAQLTAVQARVAELEAAPPSAEPVPTP